ncbi:DUF7527 domain-containing protein [Halorubrum cibi]|uniref:DUF7527 domain-containing protein n=1 Tax=Halorubrum cibi TaxID=413815 RepID=A0A521F1F4_9EURY|nr:hypothetical protein [Halorubrum cibi]SMO89471.1 hypothetical protein SAMN06264867_11428 [Halorubrum cibi]
MDAQRREDITGWDAREFDGGFDGLRRFADRGFSGAATDGTGWLFMFDGRVVGTVDADLDGFADASGTIYEAPHQALPVLFAMQERGGEQRARYYTKDTPLSEADRKLSQGGFTGYVELSENVLSGDYYVTYTGGESMAAAFVGNARRLEAGEDAFDLANDEVGIYTVYEVDLDVREVPEADRGADVDASQSNRSDGTGADGNGADGNGTERTESDGIESDGTEAGGTGSDGTGSDGTESGIAAGAGAATAEETEPNDRDGDVDGNGEVSANAAAADEDDDRAPEHGDGDPGQRDDHRGRRESERPDSGDRTDDERGGDEHGDATDRSTGPGTDPTGVENAESESRDAESENRATPTERRADRRVEPATGSNGPSDDDVFSEEAQWRETKSIPALDPSETDERVENPNRSSASTNRRTGGSSNRSGGSSGGSGSRSRTDGNSSEGPTADHGSAGGSSPSPRSTDRPGSGRAAVSGRATSEVRERIEELESALSTAESAREEIAAERDELEAERDRIREELDVVTGERDELETERDRLEDELERVRNEVDRLRDRLDQAESRLPEGERSLSPAEARDGTNLFIRYDSKGGATLDDAHDGAVGRDELRDNLRIEHHTSFETEGLVVDGEPFESFLRGTMEYGFTRWLVEDLPFEVGETGNGSALRDLYDALPEIDRAEIGGSVSVVIQENGEEVREQRSFDLVLRDRMGNPLFVAELNDSRAPTAGATLESLVANGGVIAESNEAFAGAFAVTASFFEPDALEAASDAVGGGLFNRSKRKSFVKLSRKRGYHLCLVESREGGFHLTVPDL